MEYRQTKHQVARGTRPDAETHNRLFLLKNVSALNLTYQIRLQTYLAQTKRKKLVIRIPKHCEVAGTLKEFIDTNRQRIEIERV